MDPLVCFQGARAGKGLPTVGIRTDTGFLAGMGSAVDFQHTAPGKSLATALPGADKGLVAGMNAQVPSQVGWL